MSHKNLSRLWVRGINLLIQIHDQLLLLKLPVASCCANLFVFIILLLPIFANSIENEKTDLTLFFNEAGNDWESESLPLGNGALGATVLGNVNNDVIQFSEKTLWTGGPSSIQGYDFGLPSKAENFPSKIKQTQQLLKKRKTLTPEEVVKTLGRKVTGYGSYQSFADINMLFNHDVKQVENYKRSLDLNSAVATVQYQYQGGNYTREYFVSYPDQVIAIKLSSDTDNAIDVSFDLNVPDNRSANKVVRLTQPHSLATTDAEIIVSGQLNENGLAYQTQLRLVVEKGSVNKTSNNRLQVKSANSVWLVVAAATNYEQKYPTYRGIMPDIKIEKVLKKALNYNYDQLKLRHLADYQSLFNRVSLNIDHTLPYIPTDELLAQYKAGTSSASANRALERLYYQFGRYLLITSSRAGSLPANLQGVWNKHEYAPWSADYHVNINLQMNYWLADMTNLSETNLPLFDFIDSLIEPGEHAAKNIFGVEGWVMFLNTNIWGFTGPIDWPTAFWQPEGAAWMSLHYYEHYLFTKDEFFLKSRAYPVLKKASQFWLNTLVLDNNANQFFVTPSYSPEQGDFSSGAAMSQQIVMKLLSSTLAAAKQVADEDMVEKITKTLTQLNPGLTVGSWGQLQEWQKDVDKQGNKHRHVSHLFALHPGNDISPLTTPKLAKAAEVSLTARGDGGTGWSKAWKINFWARLFNGDHAHKLLSEQLKHSTLVNLWDNHPPFQIDGNFGATAGITEMLLQSQNNEIHLLPALPKSWPSGKVKGLKARNNIEVSINWQKNDFTQAQIKSAFSQRVNIRQNSLNKESRVTLESGQLVKSDYQLNVISFNAQKNITYLISP